MTTALRRIQVGLEATRGTPVAADTILLGTLQFTPTKEWHNPEDEERNSLALNHRLTEISKMTAMQFNSALTYEQCLQFLSMAIKGNITPTTPTNGVLTRDWTFDPALNASNAQDAFTLEYGDDQQAYESDFVMCEQLEFNFPMGEVATMSATLFGRGESKITFTGALTVPTVEDVIAQQMRIYVDNSWANLGTTELSATLANATIRIPTGVGPVRYGDGSTDFSDFSEQKRRAEVELTLRHNASGVGEYDNWAAGTLVFVRLEATGSEIEQVTPTYDKLFRADLSMRYTEPPTVFEDFNGHNTVVLRGVTMEDPTSNNDMEFLVRNTVTGI